MNFDELGLFSLKVLWGEYALVEQRLGIVSGMAQAWCMLTEMSNSA